MKSSIMIRNIAILKGLIPSIGKGLNSAFAKGPFTGYSVVGVKAIFTGGFYHPVVSDAKAFEKAAQIAYNEHFENGAPILLEKIVNVTAIITEDLE